MKKQLTLIYAAIVILLQFSYAQVPQGMNYQAIARNAAGAILPNQNLGLRFTITNGSGGSVLYQETQTAMTNQFGLFTCNIGSGTPVVGTFATISWGTTTPWLQIEMDISGGTSYINMGTSQLLSVPYALYAQTANSINSGSGYPSVQNLSNTSPTTLNFYDAATYCKNLTEAGFSDWRLPTMDEITYSILNIPGVDFNTFGTDSLWIGDFKKGNNNTEFYRIWFFKNLCLTNSTPTVQPDFGCPMLKCKCVR